MHENKNIPYDQLAAYFANEANAAQIAAVEQWKTANEALFDELFLVWQDTGTVRTGPEPDVDVDKAWDTFEKRISEEEDPVIPITRKEPGLANRLLRVAAIFIFVLGGLWLYNQLSGSEEDKDVIVTTQTFHSADTIASTTLSDGSMVKLNANSSLKYPKEFKGDSREVTLKGEAFFEVSHNPDQPFVIHAGNANIRVLGTSFNVNANPEADSVVVLVETGKVLLYNETNNVQLTAGMMGVFYPETGEVKSISSPDPNADFWKDDKLIFRNTRLKRAVQTLNRAYGVSISLNNPALNNCPLSVTFEDETIEEILNTIVETFSLQLSRDGDNIVLDGEGC
jgi:transmembrane sensor